MNTQRFLVPIPARATLWIFHTLLMCLALTALKADPATPVMIAADSWQTGTPGTAVSLESCYKHDFMLNGMTRRVKVIYTTNATGAAASHNIPATSMDGDSIPDWAQQIGAWSEEAWRQYDDFGFSFGGYYTDDDGVGTIDATIFDLNPSMAGWCCWSVGWLVDSQQLTPGNMLFANGIVLHEHWHATAWSDTRYPGWVGEGTAALMEDSAVAALDVSTSSGWWRWPIAFLGVPEENFTAKSYPSGLFWKYISERLGTDVAEPEYGMDIFPIINMGHDPANMLAAIDTAARSRPGGMQTLDTLFRDFAIANYGKWFATTDPALPTPRRWPRRHTRSS